MLTLLMLLILLYAFYRGYRRGLVMQVVRLIGFVIAMTIANRHYQPLARFISNFIPFPSVQQNTQMTKPLASSSTRPSIGSWPILPLWW